jgi:polysaccharide export outer membrane protein
MKPGNLLIVAILAPALFCSAQDKAPSAQDTAKPVMQDTSKPAAPDTTTPAANDITMPATQDTTKPVAPVAPALVVPDSYVIGATDVVAVNVFKEPTLSSSMLVRPDGMISLPLLGDVKAAGKTPLQLADEVAAKLKKYIQDPNVTVTMQGINSKKIYLIGEVGRAGPLEMTPGMTLLQAIATAGGLSPYANAKRMYILRTVDGKQQKIFVQYKKALRGDASLNLPLNPGDTIVVP